MLFPGLRHSRLTNSVGWGINPFFNCYGCACPGLGRGPGEFGDVLPSSRSLRCAVGFALNPGPVGISFLKSRSGKVSAFFVISRQFLKGPHIIFRPRYGRALHANARPSGARSAGFCCPPHTKWGGGGGKERWAFYCEREGNSLWKKKKGVPKP